MGIEWRDFTGANISTLTSLLFFCILQYISFNLHQFSLHLFQCDCRWCVIYLQFVFIYFSSTSLSGGLCSVSAFGRVQVSSSDKKGVFPDRKDKIRSAVRLVWLKISFSKVHNYLAFFFYFFYRRNGWRIFVKIKPRNKTYTLYTADFIWWRHSANFFLFSYYFKQPWRSERHPINLN